MIHRVLWRLIWDNFVYLCPIYRQNVGVPMATNYAPLVGDMFLFFYNETDFIRFLAVEKRIDIFELLSINNIHFKQMVQRASA